MKRRNLLLLIILFVTSSVNAQNLPSKKKILEPMRLANSYFMKKWPDPGKSIITNRERPSNIWTRAVYYEGLMALTASTRINLIMIMLSTGARNINGV